MRHRYLLKLLAAIALVVAVADSASALTLAPDSVSFSEPSLGVQGHIDVEAVTIRLLPGAIVMQGVVGPNDISAGFRLAVDTASADVLSIQPFLDLTWAGILVNPAIALTAWGTVPGTGVGVVAGNARIAFVSPIAPGQKSDLFFVSLDPETIHHVVSIGFLVEVDADWCSPSFPFPSECYPTTSVSSDRILVPEPSTVVLASIGLAMIGCRRRPTPIRSSGVE